MTTEEHGMTPEEYMKTDEYKEEHDAQMLFEVKEMLRSMVALEKMVNEINFYKAKAEWERARVYKAWENNPEKRDKLAYTKYWRQ